MALKRHHKIIIGSISSLLVIFMVLTSIFLYMIFVRQNIQYRLLDQKITDLQTDTQTKLNELTTSHFELEEELNSLGSQVGSIDKEISTLKTSISEDFSSIIEDSVKSVVTIRTDISQGTGFIIHEQGYVVTNAHIIKGASSATAITYDGEMHQVILVGTDDSMDITLLKIEGDYTPLEFADSDDVQVGEKVIAIGNPLGLQFSVSEGIVSAVHRGGINDIEAYIQTDAALNPGNSGGPLINKQGEVIGINNFKVGGGESLGFALESNYIRETVNNIFQEAFAKNLIVAS
jgi:S1-C subfamily serine protease